MNNKELFLKVKNLSCIRGGYTIFSNISFLMFGGETLIIKGRNGTGKTSLLLSILGLISFEGFIIWAHNIKNFGFISHKDCLKSYETVEESLNFWSSYYKSKEKLNYVVECMNLSSYLDLPTGFLSAGQKKRLSLGKLMLTGSKVWVLDEPSSSLDKNNTSILKNIIEEHNNTGGIALVASHDSLVIKDSKVMDLNNV